MSFKNKFLEGGLWQKNSEENKNVEGISGMIYSDNYDN